MKIHVICWSLFIGLHLHSMIAFAVVQNNRLKCVEAVEFGYELWEDGRPQHDRFKRAFNTGKFSEDDLFIVFRDKNQKAILGKVISVYKDRIEVERLNGEKVVISGEDLEKVQVSRLSRAYFERQLPLGESEGDAYRNDFRRAWNSGSISGQDQYVHFRKDNESFFGRIIFMDREKITIEDGSGRHIDVSGTDLYNVESIPDWRGITQNVATISLNPIYPTLQSSRSYSFLSQRVNNFAKYRDPYWTNVRLSYGVRVNFDDPSLQRWMVAFTDIIGQETGIYPTPGMDLSERDKHRIYNIWIHHLVPQIEDQSIDYGESVFRMRNRARNGLIDLGQVLDKRAAVCLDLSVFASVLFSEYGMRSKVVSGDIDNDFRDLIHPRTGQRFRVSDVHSTRLGENHAWLQLYDNHGQPTGIIDSNNKIRFYYSNQQDYSQSLNGVRPTMVVEVVRPQ